MGLLKGGHTPQRVGLEEGEQPSCRTSLKQSGAESRLGVPHVFAKSEKGEVFVRDQGKNPLEPLSYIPSKGSTVSH